MTTNAPSITKPQSPLPPEPIRGLTPEELAACRQIPSAIRYVDHESFALPSAEDRYGPSGAEQMHLPAWTHSQDPTDAVGISGIKAVRLSRSEEKLLFLKYNYARYRLAGLLGRRRRRSAATARRMIRWHRRVTELRAMLVRANMALVVAMANRFQTRDVEFAELVAEGNMAMLRSVELFDASRGFKFSTYACRAILKALSRQATKAARYRSTFSVEFDPNMEHGGLSLHRHRTQRQDAVDDVREVVFRNRAGLGELERTIVLERFPLATNRKRRTFAEISRMVGLSPERVRQIQAVALRKIHAALSGRRPAKTA